MTRAEVLEKLRALYRWAPSPVAKQALAGIGEWVKAQEGDTADSEQGAHLARVGKKIAPFIVEFFHRNAGAQFHMEDLRHYVQERAPAISPDSPSRVMRDLKAKSVIDYVLLSRRDSLYQVRAA